MSRRRAIRLDCKSGQGKPGGFRLVPCNLVRRAIWCIALKSNTVVSLAYINGVVDE